MLAEDLGLVSCIHKVEKLLVPSRQRPKILSDSYKDNPGAANSSQNIKSAEIELYIFLLYTFQPYHLKN